MNYYWGFGLRLRSQISLPELIPDSPSKEIDLSITIGKCPSYLEGPDVVKKVRNWARPNEFLIWIENVCRLYITNGNSIVVEPLGDQPDWQSVRVFLLSSGFAAALHQKGYIPLHASAVQHKGGVIILMGISGAGKSTAASFLDRRGYPIFSDDVCVIKEMGDAKQVEVISSYPMARHCDDTIDHLNDPVNYNKEHPVRKPLMKYGNYFHDRFVQEALPLYGIIHLAVHNENKIEVKTDDNFANRVLSLHHHVYRKGHLEGLRGREILFRKLTILAQKYPITKIARPSYEGNIDEFIESIEIEINRITTASVK